MAVTSTLRSACVSGAIALVALAPGCADGTSSPVGPKIGIYSAAIRWILRPPAGSNDPPPGRGTVYVEDVDDARLALEVEVGVVDALSGDATIRFIDGRQEAIDTTKPGDPVRGDGVLVGLGSLPPSLRSPVRLYVDRYTDADDVLAYELTVGRSGAGCARRR